MSTIGELTAFRNAALRAVDYLNDIPPGDPHRDFATRECARYMDMVKKIEEDLQALRENEDADRT